jgi:hypothetical protein
MIAALRFAAGIVAGIIGTVIAGIVIINLPPPARRRPIYAVNGGRSTRTTGPQSLYDQIQSRLK